MHLRAVRACVPPREDVPWPQPVRARARVDARVDAAHEGPVGLQGPVSLGPGGALMEAKLPRTLFLSRGNQAVAWYRCALPAIALGCDWVCYGGEPPNLSLAWGKSEGDLVFSDLERYDVVIVQQPDGLGWAKAIRELQAKGIVVLADYDDDMH